jgi:hypothetical protein
MTNAIATKGKRRLHLRSVPAAEAPEPTGIRRLLLASWRSAKLQQQRGAVTLTAAAAAGLFLEACGGDAGLAIARVEGSDDWSLRVRDALGQVVEAERG